MSRALEQALRDWQSAGVDGLAVGGAAAWPESAITPAAAESAAVAEDPPPKASDLAASAKLQLLEQQVAQCVRCAPLAAARTHTVFGEGDPDASILFLGEAPGADEDATGRPFVGKAGQLLDKIIAASGWRRDDLYVCNVLRCRPPGNRNPTPEEAGNCRQWLDGQLDAVRPDWIVCWGTVAAQSLLGESRTIGKLRKQLFDHGEAKVLCTYHPSYLLRNPAAKKDVWSDLKFLFEAMGHTPPGG